MRSLNAAPCRALLCSSEVHERAFPTGPMSALAGKADIRIGSDKEDGLNFSQTLTLYTTPVVFLYLDQANVEFARQKQEEGVASGEAAVHAARTRLRPILMTSLAFIFGVVPLAVATGAGAEMRQSLGKCWA
jgi:multidrug efflux pump subunit AcrB